MDLSATDDFKDGRPVRPVDVLLVEDSSAIQDLIELMLGAAGHHVTIAGSGAVALDALATTEFDVVLCDFHLPDITGLDVVRRFKESAGTRPQPSFVAITGDVRGLLADRANCEMFDRVVAKPLDIDLIRELVEQPRGAPGPAAAPVPVPTRTAIDTLGLALAEWPHAAGPAWPPGLDGYDAILVREAVDLPRLWSIPGVNLMPVLDATGQLEESADLDVSTIAGLDAGRITALVDVFHDRRREIHPDILRSRDAADRLLCRLHLAGGTLTPRLSNAHDGLAAWNTIADPRDIDALLTRLRSDDLVTTTFYERLHACPNCRSGHVVVREECPTCASSHLEDDSYLHHFRCAFQAPEGDFRQGDDLICPKCRRELSHFGRDYDRPGTMIRCHACGEVTSDAVVAFICTECTSRTDADRMPVRDIVAAKTTEAGRAYLRAGSSYLGPGRTALRFGDFPLELTIALNRAARDYNEAKTPFALGYIRYDRLPDIESARAARDTRRLWLETFQRVLGEGAFVAKGRANDFFLLFGADRSAVDDLIERARVQADGVVRGDLGCQFELFGPEDLAS